MRIINVAIDEKTYRKLRLYGFKVGKSMRGIVRELVEKMLRGVKDEG